MRVCQRKIGFGDTRLDATAVFNADATLSPQDMMLTPHETTDSGVYKCADAC